jgi:hypothetical protein
LAPGVLQRNLKKHPLGSNGERRSAQHLVAVRLAGAPRHWEESAALEVIVGRGRRIGIGRDFDSELLARVVRVLEEA